jgi:hypothetical protein
MSHVEVNEAKVLASGRGASWWVDYRLRNEQAGRIEVLTASVGGDRVAIACDTQGHAAWLAALLVAKGLPTSAVAVKP